jgi:hypothetical protein
MKEDGGDVREESPDEQTTPNFGFTEARRSGQFQMPGGDTWRERDDWQSARRRSCGY